MRNRVLWITVLLLALCAGARPAYAQQDNFIVIEVASGSVQISPALEALYQENRLFLPVSYFSDNLDVPITYDAARHELTGWLESESNTVGVDFAKHTGSVGKKMFDFSPQDFIYYDGELFLDTQLIDAILTTHSTFDFAAQRLQVETAGNLPFEKELSRRQKQKRFDVLQGKKEAARLENINKEVFVQNDWLQPPFLDLSARYNISKNKGARSEGNFSYSANATFLTGGFDSEFNAYSSSSDEAPLLTFKTAREDDTGHILGLFKHLEMGDTYAYTNAENSASPAGWGIKMSTESSLEAEGKTYTFRDALPLGWEVELYRNGELLGYQNNPQNGYFEFADIPLLLGKNNFKLVFYGPQGQTKEKAQTIFFNGNVLDKGKGRLRLNYVNKNRYLIQTRDKARDSSLGHSAFIQAGYGLSDNLTLNVSAIADSLELFMDYPPGAMYRKDKTYAAADVSLFAYGIFSSVGTVFDFQENAATLDYYGQTSLWDWDIVLENTYYGRAITARNLFNDGYIKNETNFRLNKNLSLGKISLPFSYTFRHFSVVDESRTQTEQTVSISQTLPYRIYVNAQYQNGRYFSGARSERVSVSANRVQGPWTVRANSSYDFVYDRIPGTEVSVYRSVTPRLKAGVRYAYQARNLTTHSYESLYAGNVSWLTRYGYISFEAGTSNRHNSYAFIGYNMSLLPDVRNRRLYTSGSKLQGTGALAAFAYMDKNGNGFFDEDEEVLPDAQFSVKPKMNVYDSYKEAENGSKLLTHLSAYREFEVNTDISQVEDTLSLLNTAGTRNVKLRPAQVAYLSFPMVGTGDIEGTIYRQTPTGQRTAARGLVVNLYKAGVLVGKKVSEFDGYYSFSQIALGEYTLEIDPDQAAELELRQSETVRVDLAAAEQLELRDITVVPVTARKASSAAAKTKKNTAKKVQKTVAVPSATLAQPVAVSTKNTPQVTVTPVQKKPALHAVPLSKKIASKKEQVKEKVQAHVQQVVRVYQNYRQRFWRFIDGWRKK